MNGEIKRLIDTQSLNKEYFIFEKYSNIKEKKIIRMLSHPFLFIMMGIFVLISFTTISFLVVDFFSFIVIALFYRKRVIKKPPAVLYHGTAQRFLDSIRIHGLLPQKRQYVHLSQDVETAILVGKRRDEPRENKTIFNRGYLLSMVFIS